MQEMHHGPSLFDFIPITLTLPREASKLQALMRQNPSQFWIIKPAQSSQGKGIYITNDFNEISQNMINQQNMSESQIAPTLIASHYISNPLLIDGLKFDLRIYVAVTSVEPLRIYVYDEGLTRFATEKYTLP